MVLRLMFFCVDDKRTLITKREKRFNIDNLELQYVANVNTKIRVLKSIFSVCLFHLE